MRSLRNPTRLTYLIAFIAALAVAFVVRTVYYHPGPLRIANNPISSLFYRAPQVAESTPVSIESLADAGESAAVEGAAGRTILIDSGHDNGFHEAELTTFTGRLASSGAEVMFVEESDLAARLSEAAALVVIAPGSSFSAEELRAISGFVAKGGRLVMVGEPTRQSGVEALNSLAGEFGLVYQDAYIYNLAQNDGGFRNVVFTEFGDSPVTEGLHQVVFQTAYALGAPRDSGVILGDENTYSSRDEQPGGVIAAAVTGDGGVLALPDLTFLTSPYNTFADNSHLMDNVAAFVLTGVRGFDLADFPFFFNVPTQIVYQNPSTLDATFDDSVALRNRLAEVDIPSSLAEEIGEDSAFIYVSLYEDASREVLDLLEDGGVSISDAPLSDDSDARDSDGTITVEEVARLERGGTTLLHLAGPPAPVEEDSEEEDAAAAQYRLVILASDEDTLSSGMSRLLAGDLANCLVTPRTAVCHDGEVSGGEEEGTPEPGGEEGEPGEGETTTADLLVVSDDQGLAGPVGQSSAEALSAALEDLSFTVTTTSLTEDGLPDLDTLNGYDAVFWTIGDFCCKSPNEDGIALLSDYVSGGGRLFVDGLFVATDWSDSDFLSQTLSAALDGFAPQVDIEPSDESHPLSEGFEGTITFQEQDTTLQPDIITPLGDAVTVFVRGPESERAGDPSLIAYDDGSAQVAYAAFPLFLLEDGDLSRLVENAVGWFTASAEEP